ncbi:hypothetical protein F2Q70_00026788 [Brassica cretica]|uniref:PH domain-containing protein n=1 Tax=Brassica cretica TaxID=69181 RepID=A0A8S9L4Z5_BRACR|nr:hypothetical protein F2Q70_00026788 [Brassica cretica]
MEMPQIDGRMEGWLYTIRHNRFGLQFSRKRYFVLHDNNLTSFKSVPSDQNEEPDRRASLDCCIRVTDNGRESFHRKILFIFTLYNTSNHLDQLKLGASSPEEAAKWIRSLQDASQKKFPFPDCEFVSHAEKGLVKFNVSRRSRRKNSVDWTNYSSVNVETIAPDVIAPSPWKIFGCQNGLRLFKEAKDWDSRGRATDRDATDREATDREAPVTEGGGEYGTDEYDTEKDAYNNPNP